MILDASVNPPYQSFVLDTPILSDHYQIDIK